MPSEAFRPAHGLTTALTIVLGLAALLNLAFAFLTGWVIYVFNVLGSAAPLESIPFSFLGHWLGWDQVSAFGFGGILLPLPTLWPWRELAVLTVAVLFMIWLYRAHKNLIALGVQPVRYRSHWAITGYLVPFLNLVRPFQVVREVWKGSSAAPEQPTAALVRLWWEFSLLTAILANLNSYIETANRVEAVGLVLACYLMTATTLILQLTLVRRIHGWQLERAGQAPSSSRGAVWTSPLLDLGAVALAVLVAVGLYWHSARVVDAAAAHWMEKLKAAEPPPPEPAAGVNDQDGAIPMEKLKAAEPPPVDGGVVRGVQGGVPGGIEGGVIGGVPSSTPASAPKRVRLTQTEMDLNRIAGSPPAYPAPARQARIQGTVNLAVTIGIDGRVSNVRVLSGHPLLVQPTINAVQGWRYKPFVVNGEPVEVETTVSVVYRLSD